MKRAYKKPSIAVESFQLNATIAGACADGGGLPLNHGMSTCVDDKYSDALDNGYFNMSRACNVFQVDSPSDYCYHGPVFEAYFES